MRSISRPAIAVPSFGAAHPRITRRESVAAVLGAGGLLALGAGAGPASAAARSGQLFVLGDSWAAGLFADPAHALGQVAARVLGMSARVDAVSGTGFVETAGAENYLQRAQHASGAPRLVVVQGGSNDDDVDGSALAANARSTMLVLQQRLPKVRMLMLGPGPDPEPVTAGQRAVDATLRGVAGDLRIPYVSMLREDWIPTPLADSVIDPLTRHPTTTGQVYLGTRLAAAVRLRYSALLS